MLHAHPHSTNKCPKQQLFNEISHFCWAIFIAVLGHSLANHIAGDETEKRLTSRRWVVEVEGKRP